MELNVRRGKQNPNLKTQSPSEMALLERTAQHENWTAAAATVCMTCLLDEVELDQVLHKTTQVYLHFDEIEHDHV